jgi:hypothetical protein
MSLVQWVVTVFAALLVPAKASGTHWRLSRSRFRGGFCAHICNDTYGAPTP